MAREWDVTDRQQMDLLKANLLGLSPFIRDAVLAQYGGAPLGGMQTQIVAKFNTDLVTEFLGLRAPHPQNLWQQALDRLVPDGQAPAAEEIRWLTERAEENGWIDPRPAEEEDLTVALPTYTPKW